MKRRIYCSWLSLDKSLHLSLQACKVDRPGGHAEPDHALEVAGLQTADQLGWREVRRELFDCIQREVRDELNIPLALQEAPELLGTVYNHERAGRLCNTSH